MFKQSTTLLLHYHRGTLPTADKNTFCCARFEEECGLEKKGNESRVSDFLSTL